MSPSGNADSVWRKSTRSYQEGNCIEVAGLPGAVAVRDSKNPAGPALTFARSEWSAFAARIRAGQLDL